MTSDYVRLLRSELPARGVEIADPLTAVEIADIEETFGFSFPTDLRALLEAFVPAGEDWPDWHQPRTQKMLEWLDAPAEEITFDVEANGWWLEEWGVPPVDNDDAVEEVRSLIARAPILIPVYLNHFLPAHPHEAGNPVLTVVQSEITVAGNDLGWFFHDELGTSTPPWTRPPLRAIAFWSHLVR